METWNQGLFRHRGALIKMGGLKKWGGGLKPYKKRLYW